jgi:hypothetical protein
MWFLAIFSGWVRVIPINWAKRDSTTKEKAKDTQNFWLFAISCGFFWEASRQGRGGGKRWEGGKVGRSRGEGRRSRGGNESGTQELKRIKVSRGGAEARRWEGGKVGRSRVEGRGSRDTIESGTQELRNLGT